MFQFIKKIWAQENRKQKIILPEDKDPDSGEIYFFNRLDLLKVLVPYTIAVVFLFALLFTYTPIGNIVPAPEDREVRNQIIEIHQRLASLRDTLVARDMQLEAFKTVIRESRDTTFAVELPRREAAIFQESEILNEVEFQVNSSEMFFRPEDIIHSTDPNFRLLPDFPTDFPISGTLTRGYNPETGHYGIDIATTEGEPARNVADGMVVFAAFTIRYGYVVIVLHNDDYTSVYKHINSLSADKGTFVRSGQILGTIGTYGTLTSGPHLHFELWKNKIPVNPLIYFPNLIAEN